MMAQEYAKLYRGVEAAPSVMQQAPDGAKIKQTRDGRPYAEVSADKMMQTVLGRGIT